MLPYNLTDMEVHLLMTRPWIDELSPVYLKQVDDVVYGEVPLLRQMLRLLSILDETGGLKLTSIGNMPPAVVRELYSLGVPEWDVEEYYKTLNSESKTFSVRLARVILKHLGFIRTYKGKLVITKAGKTMSGNPSKLLPKVMFALCTDFYMGFFDGYPEELDLLTYGAAAMYVSLSKFGNEFRPTSFYKDEYCQFLPDDWTRFDNRHEYIEWSELTSCIRARIFERHLDQLGLVEIKPVHYPEQRESEVKRTPLFDKLIGVRISRNEAMKASGKIYS